PDAFDSDGDGRPDSFDNDGDGIIDSGVGAGGAAGGGGGGAGANGGSGDGFGKFAESPEGKTDNPGDAKGVGGTGGGAAGPGGISGADSDTGKALEKEMKIVTGRILLLRKIESEDLGLAGEAKEGSDEDFLDELDKPKAEEEVDAEKEKEKILDDVIRIETVLDKWRKVAKAKKEGDVDVFALEKANTDDLPRNTAGELDFSKIEIWIVVDWKESEPKRYRLSFPIESEFSPKQGQQVAVKGALEKIELPQDILDEIGGTVHGLEFDSVVLSTSEDKGGSNDLDLDGSDKKDTDDDLGDLDDLDD
ncbi:MAG: hypothetical protein P1V97_30565, partial [Planctomycetota bacterium]|nr:hypothetical protein [Planctomycetota bacterium]